MIDIVPRTSTMHTSVTYMEETTYTNAASATAEAGSAPEATLEHTEREVNVRKVSVHIPATREDMEDEPQVESYLTDTMPFMVRQKVDDYILTGDGTATIPEPIGLLNTTNIQDIDWAASLAKPLNTLKKAKTKVRFGGRSIPTHYVMNPEIWDDVVLSESSSGGYYYGSPQSDFEERAWGLPVVLSDHLSAASASGTANGLVGSFMPMWIQMRVRRELETEMGFSGGRFPEGQNSYQIVHPVRVGHQATASVCDHYSTVKAVDGCDCS